MSAKKDQSSPASGKKRKPAEVTLYKMPENLDEMSDEEIMELATRICADFRAAAKKTDC